VSVGKEENLEKIVVFQEFFLEDPRRRRKDARKILILSRNYTPSSRELAMRIAFAQQPTLDCPAPDKVPLNLHCRDEIVPILRALQFIYSDAQRRQTILDLVGKDVNRRTRKKFGRPGLSYWEITVLAAMRLGCNLDYDKLQNLAEEHRTLRRMMGIGSWEEDVCGNQKKFDWRTIRDNLCLLRPETLQKLNQAVVAAGHTLAPEAIKQVRGDSFVVETNIHYPTESSLIGDGLRKVLTLSAKLARDYGVAGWRQHEHLHKIVRAELLEIRQAARSKSAGKEARLQKGYRALLATAKDLLSRATVLLATVSVLSTGATDVLASMASKAKQQEIKGYVTLTQQVCDTARRRVLEKETVSNGDKLFSIFEPHTELIKRDKQPNPIQYGHNVLVIEDAVGFVCYYEVMANGVQDVAIVVPAMKALQKRSDGKIERASFDRGFHSPENQQELAGIVPHPCLATKGAQKGRKQQEEGSVEFRESRRRHPGVESAIGALQAGNGMERCRDRSKQGYERYVGLGILGRNLHVLGKLLIAQEDSRCQAGKSKRKEVA
jgi:transposase, IS5 family